MTSFECIFRACAFESPATGDALCLWDAAAATGTENKDRVRGEEALRKIDANTLAACAKSREACAVLGRV